MPMVKPCTCGHAIEEHGNDPEFPGSTSCQRCDCIAYEADHDEPADLRQELGALPKARR